MQKISKENKIFIELLPFLYNGELNDNNINIILKEKSIEEEDFYFYFPYKTESLCNFYFKNMQDKLESKILRKMKTEKSISKKVSHALSELIDLFEKDKKICLYFLNYMASRPLFLKKLSLKFANRVWFLLKDKSVDFNYYTKRMILSQILIKSILHWRGSENLEDTKNYIVKQIYYLGKFGYYKNNVKKFTLKYLPKNFLSNFDFLHKS